MAAPISENEQLERVFLSLGLAETDEKLESIIKKYLVPILSKLSSEDKAVRTKVMELLAHINKRLKFRENVQLPVEQLINQFNNSNATSFITNFTTIYIKTGYPRLSDEDKIKLAPILFSSLKGKHKSQQDIILRILVSTFPLFKLDQSVEAKKNLFQFHLNPESTSVLLDFCLDIMILPYSSTLKNVAFGSARPVTAPPGNQQQPPANSVPAGLSRNAVKRIVGDVNTEPWTLEFVEKLKIAIINFIKADLFEPNSIAGHLVVGASDSRYSVATNADLELRKQLSVIDWESDSVVTQLYKIYLGQAAILTRKNVPPDDKREPANIRMKLKLLVNLMRSKKAAGTIPQSIQVSYGGLFPPESAKLTVLTVQFIHHIFDNSDESKLMKQGQLLLDALLKTLKNKDVNEKARSLAYVGVGKLAQRMPHFFAAKFQILDEFFQALKNEESIEMKMSIQNALSMMANAYKEHNTNLIEALISDSIAASDHYLKLAGVRYASIFPQSHVISRYQLLIAAGDNNVEVASEAQRFLFGKTNREIFSSEQKHDQELPSFKSMLKYIYMQAGKRLKSTNRHVIGTQSISFPPATFQSMFTYLRRCLMNEASVSGNEDANNEAALAIVEYIRKEVDTNEKEFVELLNLYVDLLIQYLRLVSDVEAVFMLLEAIASCPIHIAVGRLISSPQTTASGIPQTTDAARVEWIKSLCKHNKDMIRQYGAELYAVVLNRDSPTYTKYTDLVTELLSNLDNKKYEIQHGGILLLGYVLGDWLKIGTDNAMETNDNKGHELMVKVFSKLVKIVKEEKDQTMCGSACFALGEISRKVGLPLPDGMQTEVGEVMEAVDLTSLNKLHVIAALASRTKENTVHKVRERAVVALGRLNVGAGNFPHSELVLSTLLQTSAIKDSELHFSVGPALSSCALGVNSPERRDSWDRGIPVSDTGAGEGDKMEWLLGKILGEYVGHRTPSGRQASCIWLLTMLKTPECTNHPAVKHHLMDLQQSFTALLSEPDELTQDIASKGFGIVYELADDDQKKVLVDHLVGSLTGSSESTSPASKVRIVGDEGNSLFSGGAVQLGKAPDGSKLTTYKELCSLASDLNQPDLVYKFLHLANHHALWNTKKGMAFGFRSIAVAARDQLKPHLPKIVPRLYRYTFDPQPSVRSAMTSIWNVVVPEPIKTVDMFMESIIEDLSKNMQNKLWRVRQSSLLALSDLLKTGVNRKPRTTDNSDEPITTESSAELVARKLSGLWKVVFMLLDDVKESVREAAETACKVLNKITLKLCDREQGGGANENHLSEILSILLKDGMMNSVKDVRRVSLSTLVEISKVSGPLIKPCIPKMVVALIEALSGLEAPELNYFHNRSGHSTQDALDWLRAEAVKSSALMETALRCCKQCDEAVMKELAPALAELTKRGVGICTKAGCAHLITSLISTNGSELTPYAGKLTNALVSGLLDRSLAVRKVNSTALGHLARVAKDATLEKTLTKMKAWYLEKDDENASHASSSVVYAIARHCPDALSNHATLVLPLAFYGMHEPLSLDGSKANKKATTSGGSELTQGDDVNFALTSKEMWEAIWNEFTPGFETAVKLYIGEIIELASQSLQSQSWKSKAQAANSMSAVARKQKPGTIVTPHLENLLSVLLSGLQGRTWEGKQNLLEAISSVAVHCSQQLNVQQFQQIITALFRESRREKATYRTVAITSLASTLQAGKVDEFSHFWDLVKPLLVKNSDDSSDSDDSDRGRTKRSEKKKLSLKHDEAMVKSIPLAWPVENKHTQFNLYKDVLSVLSEFAMRSTFAMQVVSLDAIKSILNSLKQPPQDDAAEPQFYPDLECVLLDTLCGAIVNMKFSAIREAGLKNSEVFLDLFEGKRTSVSKDGLNKLIKSLQESEINPDSAEHKTESKSFLKRLTDLNLSIP